MTKIEVNRQNKDALFALVFGGYPENALSLYNAINGTDYTDCDDLKIITLREERAKVENLLIRGLTEEEQQMLKELQIKDAREEGREAGRVEGIAEGRAEGIEIGIVEAKLEDVDKLAADGTISAEKACELLEVSMEDYKKWKAGKEN